MSQPITHPERDENVDQADVFGANEVAYLEHDGFPVAMLRWSSNGVGIHYADNDQALASELDRFIAGMAVCTIQDMPGLIYGEWVTAKKARFG